MPDLGRCARTRRVCSPIVSWSQHTLGQYRTPRSKRVCRAHHALGQYRSSHHKIAARSHQSTGHCIAHT
eukprot:3522339-Rhodomonas_salina.1